MMSGCQGHYGRRLSLLAVLFLVAAGGLRAAENNASEERMRKDIFFLASDECEGRGISTKGINLAADYIANEFKKAGLKPAGADGTYFQPFTISGGSKLESPNTLVLQGPQGQEIELQIDKQFEPMGLSGAGKVTAPLVFVGYGITTKDANYDDYKDVDVAGKIIVLLRKTPRSEDKYYSFDGANKESHAALATKAANAGTHKAAAVIFLNDAEYAKDGDPLLQFSYSSGLSNSSALPAVHLRRCFADQMIQSSLGVSLRDLEEQIDEDLKPRTAPLTGWQARLEVNVRRSATAVKNVVGVLEGTGPTAKETIILGAHYDHLGYGGMGSLARLKNPAIHHGADDNGSGTTALMELARRFGQMPQRDRRLVFIAFSGEETGLLGSAHYCRNPIYPLADTIAMVNMDMVGRLRPDKDSNKDKLIVYGTGTAKTFDKLIDDLNESFGFKLQKVTSGYGPSDHASFYAKAIPVFFFFTGDHPDYHRPSDTADKINIPGMRKVTDLMEKVVVALLTAPDRPEYIKVAAPARRGSGSGPRLGFQPAYGDDKDGVLMEQVIPGGAADKAGLKSGDRIVEIGGKAVKNLEAYMALMATQKKDQTLEVGILRDGKKQSIQVKLE
jgi:hypothetical protein